jgi:pimeloyl-ACP methyl ester carboxylesterase
MALDRPNTSGLVARLYALGFRSLAREHTVYVVHRPAGIPAGAGTRDIAADHAAVLGPELGPVRVMGLSTGGLVAQYLAVDHPGLVERLALVVSGARLAPPGRRICSRWQELADAGRWRWLRGDLTACVVDGPAAQGMARVAGMLAGGAPSAREAADFRATVDAVLAHDTRALLGCVTVPTLVLGGAADPFFPEPALRETAAALPDATLRVLPGGHGLPKQRAGQVQREVAAFLAGASAPARRPSLPDSGP